MFFFLFYNPPPHKKKIFSTRVGLWEKKNSLNKKYKAPGSPGAKGKKGEGEGPFFTPKGGFFFFFFPFPGNLKNFPFGGWGIKTGGAPGTEKKFKAPKLIGAPKKSGGAPPPWLVRGLKPFRVFSLGEKFWKFSPPPPGGGIFPPDSSPSPADGVHYNMFNAMSDSQNKVC